MSKCLEPARRADPQSVAASLPRGVVHQEVDRVTFDWLPQNRRRDIEQLASRPAPYRMETSGESLAAGMIMMIDEAPAELHGAARLLDKLVYVAEAPPHHRLRVSAHGNKDGTPPFMEAQNRKRAGVGSKRCIAVPSFRLISELGRTP